MVSHCFDVTRDVAVDGLQVRLLFFVRLMRLPLLLQLSA